MRRKLKPETRVVYLRRELKIFAKAMAEATPEERRRLSEIESKRVDEEKTFIAKGGVGCQPDKHGCSHDPNAARGGEVSEPTFAELYAAFGRFNPDHVKHRLDTLAHNIAIAGALCKAFWLGLDGCDRLYYEQAIAGIHDWPEKWHPGCGRSAP